MENDLNFTELSGRFMQMSQEGMYSEALDLIETHQQLFTRPDIYATWRSCMRALMGEPQAAIAILEEALAEGIWWPPVILRDDPDYKTLQGLPGFEAVVLRCSYLFNEASIQARPEQLVIQALGVADSQQRPLLIALHGRGNNLHTHQALWSTAADCGWQTALLGSSQVVGQDAFCWDNRSRAENEVGAQVEALCQLPEVDAQKVIMGGFSQSGGLVLHMVLNGLVAASGVIAVVPAGFSDEDFERLKHSTHLEGKRVVILASKNDWPSIKTAKHLDALLTELNVALVYKAYDNLGHDFPPDFNSVLPQYLAFLAGETAS